MKKINIYISCIFILFSISISAKDVQVEINGNITNAENRTIYLQTFVDDHNLLLDSIKLDKKGRFVFKTTVNKINFYSLKLSGSKANELVLLILDENPENSKIVFKADANALTHYSISGSNECDIIKSFVEIINNYQENRINYANTLNNSSSTKEQKVSAKKMIDSIDNNFKLLRNQFINTNYQHLAVIVSASSLNPQNDLEFFKKIETGLKISAPNSDYHIAFTNQIKQIENQISIQKKQKEEQERISNLTKVGNIAPELNFPDPNGEIITLESLKGKYVLIDFWIRIYMNFISRIRFTTLVFQMDI